MNSGQMVSFSFTAPCLGETGALDERGMFRVGRLQKTQALFEFQFLFNNIELSKVK